MKSATDDSSPPKESDLDGLLAGWPEVATPEGGFDALAERVKARISDAAATVDSSVDAFERPVLDGGAAEEAAPKSNGAAADTLAALARESAAPKRDSKKPAEAEDKSSSSGVINFKALIEQSAAEDAAGAKALAEAARPAEAVDLAKTMPATPVSVAAAGPAAVQPVPERRSNAATWALVAVIGVACIVAYTTFGARGSAPAPEGRNAVDEETSRSDEQGRSDDSALQEERGPSREANQAPAATAPQATDTVSAPADDREGAAPGTAEHAAGPTKRPATRAAGGAGREASESPAPAAPPAAPAAPSGQAETATNAPPQAATKRATADLDDLISGSLGGASGPAPGQPAAGTKAAAPPEGALPQPNRQQIQRGMGRVAGAVRACANGQSGMAMMRVTFVSDGSVSNVSMAGGPFAGTPSAGCMENAVRSARVPPFTNPNVTISYPFVIQPPDPAAPPAQ